MYFSALQNLAEVGTQSNCLGLGFKLFEPRNNLYVKESNMDDS